MNNEFQIGDKWIGDGHPVFIMADVGANHNGDFELAKEFVRVGASIGLDGIKFQSFVVDKYHAKRIKKDGKMVDNPKYHQNLPVEMPEWWHPKLKALADELGIVIMSTSDDVDIVRTLTKMDFPAHKLSSQDLIFHPLIEAMAKSQKPVVISTGLATIGIIEEALEICKREGNYNVVLLQCVTCYPSEFSEVNLKAISTLKKVFQMPIGLSDHTLGEDVETVTSLGAVAMGACMVEKHITMDRNQKGIDHHFAMEPKEWAKLVKQIRKLEESLGNGVKQPCKREINRFKEVTKCLHAKSDLRKGERLSPDNVKIVRPGDGISPKYYYDVMGMVLLCDVADDEEIKWNMISPEDK